MRSFEGLACECDVIAMREFVPAATAPLTLQAPVDRTVLLCTLLPGALPATVRDAGTVWIGAQVQHNSGDVSRDMAHALELALAAEPGSAIGMAELPATGPRLQDLLDLSAPLDVTVHEGFDFWVADIDDKTDQVAASLEQANAAASPTKRLNGVDAAYWTRSRNKEHLRWVMPQPEERLLDALARLHAAGADTLGADTRLVGTFRAHGVLVPVWDLPVGTGAEALETPAADFAHRLASALNDSSRLSTDQRATRAGLANRQLTIRSSQGPACPSPSLAHKDQIAAALRVGRADCGVILFRLGRSSSLIAARSLLHPPSATVGHPGVHDLLRPGPTADPGQSGRTCSADRRGRSQVPNR